MEFKENTKENAIHNFRVMIMNSWTYQRLTEDEKEQILQTIEWGRTQNIIRGNFKQRWDIMQLMYTAFLNALGYKPMGWRE